MNVKEIHYHRNGVSGLGFHAAIVEDEGKQMLVIRFPKEADEQTGCVVCAAFDLAGLDKRDIAFFSNSWRGDYYNNVVDKEIENNS